MILGFLSHVAIKLGYGLFARPDWRSYKEIGDMQLFIHSISIHQKMHVEEFDYNLKLNQCQLKGLHDKFLIHHTKNCRVNIEQTL